MAKPEDIERNSLAAEGLLRELAELRDLDEQRHAHAPGSEAYQAAAAEVEARSRRLMNRLRDGTWREAAERAAKPEGPSPK